MTTKTHRSSASLARTATVCAAFGALAAAGCSAAPPPPTREAPVVAIPPVRTAPPPGSSVPPSPLPALSLTPSAAPAKAASVDREHCRPDGPAVTFEVEDDDVVVDLDAAGCPLGESHFKFNGYSYKASVAFMTELQRLVKAGDRSGLAALANYPLRVHRSRSSTLIVKDRAAFVRDFNRIYSPAAIKIILAQDPRAIFCRYDGVSIGDGILWASDGSKGDHLGIYVVNSP
jgi:hypothetical protein